MTLSRSIAWRVLLVALASGLVGSVCAIVIGRSLARPAFSAVVGQLLVDRYDERAARACRERPATWVLPLSPTARAFAYEEGTLRSRNPEAPPLRGDLYARLPADKSVPVVELNDGLRGGALLFRSTTDAPCDLVQIQWGPALGWEHVLSTVAAGGVLVMFFASALGLVAVALPLVRRIERLRSAAARVGEVDGYTALRAREDGDELDALAAILDRAHARIRADARVIEARGKALERHLADISHDLRTPLTSLQITLEQAADRTSDAATAELLARAVRDVVYVSALTNNLRLASRLRNGWDPRREVAPVDLVDLVTRVASRARVFARRRSLQLDVATPDEPLVVVCNAIAAEQAVTNIVENAVAYGDVGGHVAVVLAASDAGDRFTLEVRDDGPGVPPQELPRLGQRTFRSDEARQRDPRGSGLGLAITGEVCRSFDWQLCFEPIEPRGLSVAISGAVPGGPAG